MAGPKRRKKNLSGSAAPATAAAAAAATKTDRDTVDGNTNLEHVVLDFWSGILPWANCSTTSPPPPTTTTPESPSKTTSTTITGADRIAGATALLDGKALVLGLESGGTSSSNAPAAGASLTVVVPSTMEMEVDELQQDEEDRRTEHSSMSTRASSAAPSPDSNDPHHPTNKKKNKSNNNNNTNESQQQQQQQSMMQQPLPRSELYGFWMALGAHIVSRLLTEQSPELLTPTAQQADEVSQAYRRVLSYLCYELGLALFGNEDSITKWDKASTGPARHWLARLITNLSAALAGHALAQRSNATTTNKSGTGNSRSNTAQHNNNNTPHTTLSRPALAAATLCLERVLQAGNPTNTTAVAPTAPATVSSSSQFMGTLEQQSHHWRTLVQPLLQQWIAEDIHSDIAPSCHVAFHRISSDWSRERACLAALQQAEQTTWAVLQAAFVDLYHKHPPLRMEGRLAFRRWSPVVLEWYAQAPLGILQHACALVQSSSATDRLGAMPALAMVGRWLQWMVDWASKTGARCPSGSLDIYLKQISLGRKKKKALDLLELAMNCMFHCIELHGTSILTLNNEDGLGEPSMLNDVEWKGADDQDAAPTNDVTEKSTDEDSKLPATTEDMSGRTQINNTNTNKMKPYFETLYPFMSQLLSNLARVGVTVNTTSSVEQIEDAAAALVLQQQVFRDVHLLHWALQQVRSLLVKLDVTEGTSLDHLLVEPLVSNIGGKIKILALSQPTSSSSAASAGGTRKRKAANEAVAERMTAYDRLALFLRAMHNKCSPTTAHSKKASPAVPSFAKEAGRTFVKYVLSVVEASLDTRVVTGGYTPAAAASTQPLPMATTLELPVSIPESTTISESKKRKASTSSSTTTATSMTPTRRSKRNKREDHTLTREEQPHEGGDFESHFPPTTLGDGKYRPISSGRSALASTGLDILQIILDGHRVQRFPCLGAGTFETSDLCRIVQLGQAIDIVLLRTPRDESPTTQSYSLNAAEKQLWSSLMDLSTSVGKGKVFLESNTPLTGRRLEVFQEVARSSKAVSFDRHNPNSWPLWLPAAHRLLVSSNMANEKEKVEVQADRYIVDGVLISIKYILEDLSRLLPLIPTISQAIAADPEIPLSLQDTQLYLGALVRLPEEQRSAVIIAFASTLCDCISKIIGNEQTMDFVKKNRIISGFLARVATTCTYAAVFSTAACDVRHQILQLNSVAIGSPTFWQASEGYQLQGFFMGVLADRECTLLPGMPILPPAVDPKAAGPLRVLLETMFEMGLLTATEDNGFLMFSAWNALGKAPVWAPAIHSPLISEPEGDSPAAVLLTLRDNVCLIHRQMQSVDGIPPSTTITRAFNAKLSSSPDHHTLAANLRLLIEKCSAVIETFIARDDGQQKQLTADEFALLECSCLSLSFAISTLTKSKGNYISDMVSKLESKARPRGYSTESEAGGSDGESGATEADARVDALERIEQSVSRMGGAPTHPDWLDTSCSLRHALSMEDAQKLALKALDVLGSVLKRSKIEQHKSSLTALQKSGSSRDSPVLSELALKLIVGIGCGESIGAEDAESCDEIAKICNVNPKVVKFMMDGTAAHPSLSAVASWCANSAQRVHGHFHTLFRNQMIEISELGLGEMRIGEEWEVGLSFALTTACTGFPVVDRRADLNEGTCAALIASSQWERLATNALSCMLPSSALVRFTAYGKGRKPHPYAKLDVSIEDYEFRKVYLPELPPESSPKDENLEKVVRQVVKILASSPIHREPSSEFIVANLFTDPLAFLDLQSAASVGSALDTLGSLMQVPHATREANAGSISSIVKNLVRVLITGDQFGVDPTSGIVKFFSRQSRDSGGSTIVLGFKGVPTCGSVSPHSFGSDPSSAEIGNLGAALIPHLFSSSSLLDPKSRESVILGLGNLAILEMRKVRTNDIARHVFGSLTQIPQDWLRTTFDKDIRGGSGPIVTGLCAIFTTAFLYGGERKNRDFERLIFDSLMLLVRDGERENLLSVSALHLLFLYGAYFNELGTIGEWLMTDARRNAREIEIFFSFLKDLDRCLHSNSVEKILRDEKRLPAGVRTSCSYVLKEGFVEQHWYNCKTCGLTDEKGCCTICALVCHHGHELNYARFSSFFCDCGAQNGTSGGEDRPCTICKCLTSLSKDRVLQAYHVGRTSYDPEETRSFANKIPLNASSLEFASVAARNFKSIALEALSIILGTKTRWKDELEGLVKNELELWKQGEPTFSAANGTVTSYADIRNSILRSNGETEPKIRQKEPLVVSRTSSSQSKVFNLGISADSSAEKLLRTSLIATGTTRSVVACDSRGRMMVAEIEGSGCQMTLVNASAIPEDEILEGSVLERRLVPIIGSENLALKNIVGMALNRINERNLLVWGTDEARVCFMQSEATAFEGRIDVSNPVVGPESFVKGMWLPSSENVFAIGCGSALKIYSLSPRSHPDATDENGKILPELSISVASSFTMKDFFVVSAGAATPSAPSFWHLFTLLNNGSVHKTDIHEDMSGSLTSSSSFVGASESVVFQPNDEAMMITDNPQALHLDYLHQSRLLVYQGKSGAATALALDEAGTIRRQFTIIPETMSLGDKEIHGPYTHWNDVGVTRRGGSDYFRILCVSRCKDSEGHMVLSIELNENIEVRIGKVESLVGEAHVDGMTTWSVPGVESDEDEMNLHTQKIFIEKTYACVVQSDGKISIFCDGRSRVSGGQVLSFSRRILQSTFPTLVFEDMKSLSNSELIYRVNGCSSSDIGSKLQRDSESFFLAPTKGFTLTIAPRPGPKGTPVIAALRLQVGKTSPTCVPQKVFMGGRPVTLQQGVKRWYSIVMSAEEIALGLRNGFVTLTFTHCNEATSNPILDALDVYGIERSEIKMWLPQMLKHLHVLETSPSIRTRNRLQNNLLPAVNALVSLCSMKKAGSISTDDKELLSDLVTSTSLASPEVAASVENLVSLSITPNASLRSFLDKARLLSCVNFLSQCSKDASAQITAMRDFWQEYASVLLECLQCASGVARQRPMNYIPSLDGTTNSSIAEAASGPVARCLSQTLDYKDLVGSFVECCLLEMAVAGSNFQNKTGSLGNFAPLSALLTQQSEAIVKLSCEAISSFCKKYSSPQDLGAGDFDLFVARDLSYACDACQLTPIRGVRYTLEDDQRPFDLCQKCHELAMNDATKHDFGDTEVSINGRTVGDDPRLTCAEVKRMQSVLMQDHLPAGTGRQQLYDVFLDGLFNGLVALIAGPEGADKPAPVHLIQLVVGLVDLANRKRRVERKKRIVKELCHGISLTLDRGQNADENAVDHNLKCYIESLSALVVSDPGARDYLTGRKLAEIDEPPKQRTITCPAHDGKALCKRSTICGEKFFVCGEDKCNFFMWADGEEKKIPGKPRESEFDNEAAHHVWKLWTSKTQPDTTSLHAKICEFLEHGFDRMEDASNKITISMPKTYEEAVRDIQEGVICSRERLLNETYNEYISQSINLPLTRPECRDSWTSLLESCLELISLTVGPETDEGVSPWFAVLCKILLEEKPSIRSLAKTAVFRLCGRDGDLYFAVRDHHAFGIHMKKVVTMSWPLLSQASILRKKMLQCSPNLKERQHPFSFGEGSGFELTNLQLLLEEDTLDRSSHDSIRKLLSELVSSAKKRSGNWKRFCRHKTIPLSNEGLRVSSPIPKLLAVPPIKVLLYLVCVLPLDCQTKIGKLLDLGLTHSCEIKAANSTPTEKIGAAVLEFVEPRGRLLEKATDAISLTESGLYSFAVHFVLMGGSSELRRAAGSVSSKLLRYAEPHITENVVRRLITGPLAGVGELGRTGTELTILLSNLADTLGGNTKAMAEYVESLWSEQFLGLRHDRANKEYLFFESRVGATTQKKRYDLAPCLNCQSMTQPACSSGKRAPVTRDAISNGDGSSGRQAPGSSTDPASPQKIWLDNQVSPFSRVRIESVREAHTSSEFSTFVLLKYRMSISDVFVEVHDPRARYVKTIKVYASPRLEDSIANLKSPGHKWHFVGTLTLSQGGTRANFSLTKPVLAANLKIEYCDFFDRPGGTRSTDGSLVVHCPRCARVVNNAHGVCGNCGEVAFQCRKCRHINYDRLDAFLCVECGYCASGSFMFEVNAGIASNAMPISNEQDYRRAQHQLSLSTKFYSDILRCFKDQYTLASRSGKKSCVIDINKGYPSDVLRSAYTMDRQPNQQAALEMIADSVGRQGSVVKMLARPSASSSIASDVDCYRSVLSLGRSSGGSSASSRRRSRDIIIRHVGRDLQIDEDESDLIGLLESTDGLARASGLDPADPLSRLLASVQSRREQRNEDNRLRRIEGSGDPTQPETKSKSIKEIMDVCDKLHVLLREAERETFQLKRRISAWRCLERGDLEGDSETCHGSFVPCHCWACGGSLAGHLLLLWIRLFQADPRSVPVTGSMVRLLLQEDQGASKSLLEWKRLAVREIALKSECGAVLVLDVLRLRLRASQDVNAAEILGQIVGAADSDSVLKQQFVDLAKEQMNVNCY